MANTTKHRFASAKIQGPDPTIIGPNEWNDEHVFTGGVDGQALVRDSAASDGVSWGAAASGGGPSQLLNLQLGLVGSSGTSETVLYTYTLPANTLSAIGKALRISASFVFSSTGGAGDNIVRVYFGSQVVQLWGKAQAAPISNGTVGAIVRKTGTDTQDIAGFQNLTSSNPPLDTPTTFGPTVFTSGTQTDSAPIVIKVTGQNTGSGGANKVQAAFLLIEALN